MNRRVGTGIVFLVAFGLNIAGAEPIVRPGPEPGAVIGWRSEGRTVVLTVDEQYDPADIAQAITESVPSARARVDQDRVIVTGLNQQKLLSALSTLEVTPLLDDIDAMLHALHSEEEGSRGTGSSIRAFRTMTLDKLLGDPKRRTRATVLAVQRGDFPLVLVTLRIDRAPATTKVEVGQTITVVPRIPIRKGRILPADAQSALNIGAWYAQPGDQVEIKLAERRKRVWFVAGYRRVKP